MLERAREFAGSERRESLVVGRAQTVERSRLGCTQRPVCRGRVLAGRGS